MNKFKNRKTKRAVEHSPFLKKIAACQSVSQSVSQCVCEIVKLSGFERPQKIDFKKRLNKIVVYRLLQEIDLKNRPLTKIDYTDNRFC
jgi:hypothetical protein